MIPESFKQELLSRVDIVDIVDARVPLKKAGANFSACCPFHTEKTPSFTVSPTKQFYHCFGCGAHGNAISFLMEYGGLGYIDALRELADLAGMKLPDPERAPQAGPPVADLVELMSRAMQYYREQLRGAPRAIAYLKSRGLTGKIAAQFGIGYAPEGWQNLQSVFGRYDDKSLVECGLVIQNDEGRRYDRFRDRIMFPILSARGQVIGFGGRVLDRGEPKYLNSPETPLFEKGRELYGLFQARDALRAQRRCFVVEGYMDVVALAQHGVPNVVATLGTATTPVHVQKLLRQVDEIVFCFDGDAAGRKAAWHALDVSLAVVPDEKLLRFLFLPPEHDPDSFVRAFGAEGFQKAAQDSLPLSRYLLDTLQTRNDVATPEGRSKLLAEARPLVQKMTAPLLQLQLLQALAELGLVGVEDLARLYSLRPSGRERSRGAAIRAEPASPAAAGAAMRRMPPWIPGRMPARRIQGEGRLERQILRTILAAPDRAVDVPIDTLRADLPEAAALRALLEYLGSATGPGAAPGADAVAAPMLVEHFRDTPHAGPIGQAFADLLGVSLSPEDAGADLRGAVRQLELRRVAGDLEALYSREQEAGLSPEERVRMGDLLQQARRLKEQLREGA